MHQYTAVLPKALDALGNAFCNSTAFSNATALRENLLKDIQQFSKTRSESGYLASAFNSSSLSYNGSPIEFTSSTLKPKTLSCTMDPFLPVYQKPLDIETFKTHYHQIESNHSDHFFKKMKQAQAHGTLNFGSWIGRKYEEKGIKTKVYSEIPENPEALQVLFPNKQHFEALKNLGLTLLMAGYYPTSKSAPMEYYYQWHSAEICQQDIFNIMRFFSCEHLFMPLLAVLQEALAHTKMRGKLKLPSTTYGISLNYNYKNEIEVFTFFTIAPTFFGGNQCVVPAINGLLKQFNWQMPLFSVLSDRDINNHPIQIQHNVIGFSVSNDGCTGINTTFSPNNRIFIDKLVTVSKQQVLHQKTNQLTSVAKILKNNQLENGAFLSEVRTQSGHWFQDANAFITAQVIRALDYSPETEPYIEKGLDFLTRCQMKPYHYTFWPKQQHPDWMGDQCIAPDIDDTALITEILYQYDRISLKTVTKTLAHMNAYKVNTVNSNEQSWAECNTYHTWMKTNNHLSELDCCVNTNALILLHLADKQNTPAYLSIIKMLNSAIEWSDNQYDRIRSLTPYYAHPSEWLSTLIYAQSQGIGQLAPCIQLLNQQWDLSKLQPIAYQSTPLYCRHDGHFLWTSSYLSTLRSYSKKYIKQRLGRFQPITSINNNQTNDNERNYEYAT